MMNNNPSRSFWYATTLIIVILALMLIPKAALSQESTTIRPIEDFVNAQGTFCFPDGAGGCLLFVPPIQNFLGSSDPVSGLCTSIDYAGLADEWITDESGGAITFGTEFEGTIIERPLGDGRAHVHVILKTKNALSWVVNCPDFNSDLLLFGSRAPDVLFDGAIPALGDEFREIKLINTEPGADLPDLIQLIFAPESGQELLFLSVRSKATGELRTDFGVEDGTPGMLQVTQTGLFMTPFMGAVSDGFPAELVRLKVVGK